MRQNAGRIDATGVEGEVRRSFGDVRVNLSAAYTEARVDGGGAAPQLTGKRPAQAPRLAVTTGVSWMVSPRITVTGDARYESDRFEDDLNTRVLPASVGLDARADWRIGENTTLFLAAENLTDADIVVGQTGDGVNSLSAPRSIRLGVTLR